MNSDSESLSKKSLIYLDNSISHSIQTNGVSSFDKMKEVISELIKEYDRSTIITNDEIEFSFSSTKNNNSLEDFHSLDYSFLKTPIIGIINKMLKSHDSHFFFFSDLQGMRIREFSSIKNDSLNDYRFGIVDFNQIRNAFVDSISISENGNDFSSLLLNVDIKTSSNFGDGNLIVKLFSEGKQLSSVIKKGDGARLVQFNIPKYKDCKYRIVISGDDVEFDNSFFIYVSRSRKPKISLIADDENKYLEKVFSNKELFQLNVMNSSSVDFLKLESSDIIIFSNTTTIPNGILDEFNERTIVVFPSETLSNLGSDLGFTIEENDDRNIYRSNFDADHTFFKGVFDKTKTNSAYPTGSSLYSFNGFFEPIIKLSNGETFLAKSASSNIYMLSCPLDEKYTNLPIHGIFLPLMYQLAINSTNDNEFNFTYYPGDLITVNNGLKDIPIKIVRPDYEIIPEFNYIKDKVIIRIPSTLTPGFYSLIQDRDTIGNIAVNLPKVESIMESVEFEELVDFFSDSDHVVVQRIDDALSSNEFLEESKSGLWKIAVILVLFFLLAETLIHRYFR